MSRPPAQPEGLSSCLSLPVEVSIEGFSPLRADAVTEGCLGAFTNVLLHRQPFIVVVTDRFAA